VRRFEVPRQRLILGDATDLAEHQHRHGDAARSSDSFDSDAEAPGRRCQPLPVGIGKHESWGTVLTSRPARIDTVMTAVVPICIGAVNYRNHLAIDWPD